MDKVVEFLREYGVVIYLVFISALAFVVTVYDKIASKKLTEYRTRESTLLIISALGGSFVMLLTMHLIRHKTKHMKFMIGIPVILILQAVLVGAGLYFGIL